MSTETIFNDVKRITYEMEIGCKVDLLELELALGSDKFVPETDLDRMRLSCLKDQLESITEHGIGPFEERSIESAVLAQSSTKAVSSATRTSFIVGSIGDAIFNHKRGQGFFRRAVLQKIKSIFYK